MVALLLLGPWTPLLFQGQVFGAASVFRYFSDVGDDQLKEAIRKGRFEFLAQFPSVATPEVQERLPVPHHASTFKGCRSEEHTSELQSRSDLVCRLLLEKKKKNGQCIMVTCLAPRSA